MSRTVIRNAEVLTQDPTQPGADSLAVEGGVIVEVPAQDFGGDEVIDAGGATVLPGFTDSHIHVSSFSLSLDRLNLNGIARLDEALARVKERTGSEGEWIRGRGFVLGGFEGIRFPTREHLDSVALDNPVAISSFDGHALWVNSSALSEVGVNAATPDPPGGEIERDEKGRPTGILKETAVDRFIEKMPRPDPDSLSRTLERGQAKLHGFGITAVHSFERRHSFQALERLHERGGLSLRVAHFIDEKELEAAEALGLEGGFGDRTLSVVGVKSYADGALNVQTAHMLAPYGTDQTCGIPVSSAEKLAGIRRRARALRMPLAVHAIGDGAVRSVTDVFSSPEDGTPVAPERIEHAQHIDPADLPRIAASGVWVSMQPVHLCYDLDPIEAHLADRAASAYVLRSLSEAGVPLLFGSDGPIAPVNPFFSLYAAVCRRRLDGTPPEGWTPDQAIDLTTALACFTRNPAAYTGDLSWRGTLAPGKTADLILLDQRLSDLDPLKLKDVKVARTYVDGEGVFE